LTSLSILVRVRKSVLVIAVASALMFAPSGCGGGADTSDSDGASASGLIGALARIAATDNTRLAVNYDDTPALLELAGSDSPRQGFGMLALVGAPNLANLASAIEKDVRLAPRRATYTVSAGQPPNSVGLIAGGQNGEDVSGALTKLGWTRDGDNLVAPSLSSVEQRAASYALQLSQVRVDDAEIVYGSMKAELADAGRPSGPTLADDRRIRALADCLGDVVAAQIVAERAVGDSSAVAVGVQRPAAKSDPPRSVVCVSWRDQSTAKTYQTEVTAALADGRSLASNREYAELIRSPEVINVGGDEHVVRWRGDTPQTALVFRMLAARDLPGFAA
jgi:hypothetical protein